jgi:uncharacterized NAD-dependent epimerase/dehydratase family protein
MIETPYLLFLGDAPDMLAAKAAIGIRDWRPENALGQIRLPGCGADLGLAGMTLDEARAVGVKTVVIGVANRGGVISAAWKQVLVRALEWGSTLPRGCTTCGATRAIWWPPRKPMAARCTTCGCYPVATGVKRRGKRCLAVGTDCSVGKMYTALPLARVSNPACQVAGIAVNTQAMDEARSRAYLEKAEAGMGLPATDPYRFGSGKLVDALAAI